MKPKNAAAIMAGAGVTPNGVGPSRMIRSRANRRNTMDCAILNEMFVDDDSKHTDKRSKHLLRESERDIKRASLALVGPTASLADAVNTQLYLEERSESMPTFIRNTANVMSAAPLLVKVFSFFLISSLPRINNIVSLQVECTNQYKSVTSRPVGCRTSAPPLAFQIQQDDQTCAFDRSKLQTRRDFHETFANLIKLGSGSDKQESKVR